MTQSRVFYYHYNKPASQQAGKPQISIHQSGVCYIVDNIVVDKVATRGRIQKRQPHFVMVGKGVVRIKDSIAYVTAS